MSITCVLSVEFVENCQVSRDFFNEIPKIRPKYITVHHWWLIYNISKF